jgi:hypothetical protein
LGTKFSRMRQGIPLPCPAPRNIAPTHRHAMKQLRRLFFSLSLLSVLFVAPVRAQDASATSGTERDLDAVPARYKLSEKDKAYLPYLEEWDILPDLERAKLDETTLSNPDLPLLLGDGGWQMTVGQLNATLWANGHQAGAAKMLEFNRDLILEHIPHSAFVGLVREEAVEKGYADSAGVKSDMVLARDMVLKPVLTQYAWQTRGQPITDQMVELAYEREKMTKFRRAMGFEVRQIFLMAYEPYEVQRGDTLPSIARKISGTEAAVTEIRSNDRRRAKRWVPESQQDRLAFEPLSAGEKLLVPMDKGGMEKLWSIARQIEGRLEQGEDFEALAREFSNDDHPGEIVNSASLQGEARILPEIRLALQETPVGEATPFLRTKHGLQKFLVISQDAGEDHSARGYRSPHPPGVGARRRLRGSRGFLIGLALQPHRPGEDARYPDLCRKGSPGARRSDRRRGWPRHHL